jgi:hypothetical protein
VAAAVLVAAVLALRPRHGASEVKLLVNWPQGCADVKIDRAAQPPYLSRWHGVVDHDLIECQVMGPAVFYARFADVTALRRSLAAARPPDAVCRYGAQLVVDGLDSRAEFARLCQRLHGRVFAAGEPLAG